jgi:hypothetical protein
MHLTLPVPLRHQLHSLPGSAIPHARRHPKKIITRLVFLVSRGLGVPKRHKHISVLFAESHFEKKQTGSVTKRRTKNASKNFSAISVMPSTSSRKTSSPTMFRLIAVCTATQARKALKRNMFKRPEDHESAELVGAAGSATTSTQIG